MFTCMSSFAPSEEVVLQKGVNIALLRQEMGKRCVDIKINHDFTSGAFASCILNCTGRLVSGDFYFASFCYAHLESYVVVSFRSHSSEAFEFMSTLFNKSEKGFYPSHAGSTTVVLSSSELIVGQIISSLVFYQTLPDRTYQCLIQLIPTFWKSSVYGDSVEFFDVQNAYKWKIRFRGSYSGKLPNENSENDRLKVVMSSTYTLLNSKFKGSEFKIKAVLCNLSDSYDKKFLETDEEDPPDTQVGTVQDVGNLSTELGRMLSVLKGILKGRLPALSQRINQQLVNILETFKKKAE